MSFLSKLLQNVIVSKVLSSTSKENVNPITSPSTGVAYTSAGALAYLMSNPPGTEYDVAMQVAFAIVSVLSFLHQKNTD